MWIFENGKDKILIDGVPRQNIYFLKKKNSYASKMYIQNGGVNSFYHYLDAIGKPKEDEDSATQPNKENECENIREWKPIIIGDRVLPDKHVKEVNFETKTTHSHWVQKQADIGFSHKDKPELDNERWSLDGSIAFATPSPPNKSDGIKEEDFFLNGYKAADLANIKMAMISDTQDSKNNYELRYPYLGQDSNLPLNNGMWLLVRPFLMTKEPPYRSKIIERLINTNLPDELALNRTIIFLDVDELRRAGFAINEGLSWEHAKRTKLSKY